MLSCLCVNHWLASPEGKHSVWGHEQQFPQTQGGADVPTAHTESLGGAAEETWGTAPGQQCSSPQAFAMISFDDFNWAGGRREGQHAAVPQATVS